LCTGYHEEGYILLFLIMSCGGDTTLLKQPAAVAIARRLAAAADSEAGRLQLLLRVRASLTKVWWSADVPADAKQMYTYILVSHSAGYRTMCAVAAPSRKGIFFVGPC
jgi:hypothetical protein